MGRKHIESRLERERCEDGLGKQYCSVAAIAGVATVAGAAMTSSATSSAARGQQRATDAANAEQARQYDNNVALQAPTINTGNAARDRLSYLLGLSPTGYAGTTSVGGLGNTSGGGAPALTYDALREQMLGQYTRSTTTGGPAQPRTQSVIPWYNNDDPYADPANYRNVVMASNVNGDQGSETRNVYTGPQSGSEVDEAGLDAAIKARLAEQDAARQAQITAAQSDPNYGRLAQEFQFQTYTPDKFSYTGEDLYNDPSYKFRLDQGQKALDRQGAASGRFLSGAQLQASSNYNQGAASQEFQNAYQRALGTFGTNEGNRSNAFSMNEGNRFNAYQANFNNAVNPLLSLAGAATLGSQNLGAAGASSAAQIGANTTANANAQGAAGIANANNISNSMSGAVNSYQSNQLMNSLLNRSSVNNNPGYMASSTPAWGNNNTFGTGTTGMGD
jgi:hypothetical protein